VHGGLPFFPLNLTQVRFVLSDQTNFNAGGKEPQGSTWVLRQFYYELLGIFRAMDSKEQEDLLNWWNEYVFFFFLTLTSFYTCAILRQIFSVAFRNRTAESEEGPESLAVQMLKQAVACGQSGARSSCG
jgi:hypothetical protein